MNGSHFIHARRVAGHLSAASICGAIAVCAGFIACSDDSDGNVPDPSSGGGNGATDGGASATEAGTSGSAGAHVAGYAGDTNAGGSAGASADGHHAGEAAAGGDAGDTNAGGGDAGSAAQGGDSGGCVQGYVRQRGTCVAACAPHDLDGAHIALSVGHTDLIAAAFDTALNDLRLFVSDDSFPIRQPTAVRRKPESVLVHGKAGARLQVPDIPALSGIFEPGTDVWLFPEGQPEAQAASVLWPGFQFYGVEQGVLQGDQATLRLVSADGAGKFVGFASPQDEVTPPDLLFDPKNGLNEVAIEAGTHRHLNWAFTQGGLYRLTFELNASTLGGKVVESDQHTYRFFLGDLAELPATEPTIVVAEGLQESYAVGAELELTAVRHGAPSALPAAWSRQCYDPATFEPLPWEPIAIGDTLATTVDQDCQYVACLMDQTTVAAISQAVFPLLQ